MHFELLTLTGVKFSGDVSQVTLTTAGGEIGILPHHEALTAIAKPGPVTVRSGNKQQVFATFGGLLEVTPDSARLLADEAESAEELIHSEVMAALAAAEELKSKAKDKHELARAQELVDRHTVRLGVAKLHRRTTHPERQTP